MSKSEKNKYTVYSDKEIFNANDEKIQKIVNESKDVIDKLTKNIEKVVVLEIAKMIKQSGVDVDHVNINTNYEYDDEGLTYNCIIYFNDDDWDSARYPEDTKVIKLKEDIDNFIGSYKSYLNNGVEFNYNEVFANCEKNKLENVIHTDRNSIDVNKI